MPEEKSALEQLEELLKNYWKQSGNASVIAAKHTEFVIEPKVFLGNKLNPEILKLLTVNYLLQSSHQDSGLGGKIEIAPDKLTVKTPGGKPVVAIRDKNIIQQYLAMKR
jgi:hypothetical protein